MSHLLRIALAETDELAAYHVQGQLRKLEHPFSLRRITDPDALLNEIGRFSPDLVILNEEFIGNGTLERIKEKSPAPLIVLSHFEVDATILKPTQPGAENYIYFSRLTELPLIIEKTLLKIRRSAAPWNPHYRSESGTRISLAS